MVLHVYIIVYVVTEHCIFPSDYCYLLVVHLSVIICLFSEAKTHITVLPFISKILDDIDHILKEICVGPDAWIIDLKMEFWKKGGGNLSHCLYYDIKSLLKMIQFNVHLQSYDKHNTFTISV